MNPAPPAAARDKLAFPRRFALFASLGILLSGCVSLRSVPLPAPGQPATSMAVKVGDHVQVQTRSGETIEFKVTAIESDALVGKDRRVRFEDMSGLQVKRVDQARTAAGVGVGVGVTATVVLVAAALAVAGLAAGL